MQNKRKIDQRNSCISNKTSCFIWHNIEKCVICVEIVKQFKILYKKKTSQMQFIPQRV